MSEPGPQELPRDQIDAIYRRGAQASPQMRRGRVWCMRCRRSKKVDAAHCLEHGWPRCHGVTMTLDAPHEREPNSAIRCRCAECLAERADG